MIAFFVISTELGGAEKSLLSYLLHRADKDFVVVVPKGQGPLIDEFKRHAIEWQQLSLPAWVLNISRREPELMILKSPFVLLYICYYLWRIKKWLEQNKITRVHTTGIKFHLLIGLLACFKKDFSLTIHVRDIISSKILKNIFKVYENKRNINFVANSQVTQKSLHPIDCPIIYNGFALDDFKAVASHLKNDLGINAEKKLVGIVGVIARWKGQREFLLMAHKLLQQRDDLEFVIVGSEIYDTLGEKGELKELKKQARQTKIASQVHFVEFQKDINPIYCGLDVLVHNSIHPEPFGRVIVEAMLLGCPVTASNLGGPQEIIENGVSGLLHTPSQIAEMAENVSCLIDDQNLRESIIEKAHLRARDFSMKNYVKQMDAHLSY